MILRYPLLALLLILLPLTNATAHPALASAVVLDIHADHIDVELQMPQDQLRLALPELDGASDDLVRSDRRNMLLHYLQQHVSLTGQDNVPLAMAVTDLRNSMLDGAPHLLATLRFHHAGGSALTDTVFTLHDDLILHRVVSHKIYVTLRRDFRSAVFADQPRVLDVLRYQHNELLIDRRDVSLWQGFRALVVHGMEHISTGSDHLLFLLCLLLPAPLLKQGRRWQGSQANGTCWVNILKIVTAFTLGHSLTLAWVVLSQTRIPAQPVEVLVAASILVSALHACKPLLDRFAVAVAMGFGLLHGLAFSSTIADMGLDIQATVMALLGFNLGIELAQLLIVLAVMPCLILISWRQPRWYGVFRVTGAGFACIASLSWIIERLGEESGNPIAGLVDIGGWHGIWSYGALALLTVWAWWRSPVRSPQHA